MNKSKMRRVLSLLLIVTMLFSSNSITVLAGSDANTKSDGIKKGSGTHSESSYDTTLQIDGGGYKISILTLPLHAYEPTETGKKPIYGEGKGGAISVNGNTVVSDNTRYGIAPMYSVGYSGKIDSGLNEFAIDSNLKFDLQMGAIKGKRMTPQALKEAANQPNIVTKGIGEDIYKAFNSNDNNILQGMPDINDFLNMVQVTPDTSEPQKQRNLDVINTILNLAIGMYSKEPAMKAYLQDIQNRNMKNTGEGSIEVVILIEPMAHIYIKSKKTHAFITPANFIIGSSSISAKKYVTYKNLNGIMEDYIDKKNSNFGLWNGMGQYIVGATATDPINGKKTYTGAIGTGLGGHTATNDVDKYRESLFSKVASEAWLKWKDGKLVRAKVSDMHWGGGFLASSDYVEPVPTSRIIESNSSISVLGDMAGYTPIISVGITTNKGVADPVLDDAVSGAIEKLNSFAGENTMAIEDLDDYLSSDSCIEILKLIIENVDQSYIADTSISNKIEDINGKITELLGKGKLNIDSLLIAKYMNLLMKNSTYDEDAYITEAGTEKHIMNFNTESNRDLIRYIYTMFDDKFNSSYTVLTNIEEALYDEPETGNVERYSQNYHNNTVLKSKLNPVRQRDGAYILKERPSKPAVAGQIKFFGDTSASIMRNETTKEFSGKMSSFTSIVDGDGVVKTESDTMNKLVKLAMI